VKVPEGLALPSARKATYSISRLGQVWERVGTIETICSIMIRLGKVSTIHLLLISGSIELGNDDWLRY